MATMETDRLVDDYLQRLEDAAAHLQRSRRAELIAEIRGHIEAALREEDAAGEVAVRNVLERLGPPEEIVEAAGPPPADTAPSQKLEIVALVALLVPFLGWVVGVVLVAVSRAWTNRDKLIGDCAARDRARRAGSRGPPSRPRRACSAFGADRLQAGPSPYRRTGTTGTKASASCLLCLRACRARRTWVGGSAAARRTAGSRASRRQGRARGAERPGVVRSPLAADEGAWPGSVNRRSS